jgi:hypothetical protein
MNDREIRGYLVARTRIKPDASEAELHEIKRNLELAIKDWEGITFLAIQCNVDELRGQLAYVNQLINKEETELYRNKL